MTQVQPKLAGRLRAFFVSFGGFDLKRLSIFVDEAGDFGPYDSKCPCYIVSMLFHNQETDIASAVSQLNQNLSYLGYDENFVIHTAPLIRREEMFSNLNPNERRNLFSKLFFFAPKVDFRYKIFVIEKKNVKSSLELQANIASEPLKKLLRR